MIWKPAEDPEWQEAKKVVGEEKRPAYKGVYKDIPPLPLNYADKLKDEWHKQNRIKTANRKKRD